MNPADVVFAYLPVTAIAGAAGVLLLRNVHDIIRAQKFGIFELLSAAMILVLGLVCLFAGIISGGCAFIPDWRLDLRPPELRTLPPAIAPDRE
ncbi:MAG: hypothetical protein K8R23_16980 [Chthoniobacter sp.]|nr:hypothetical protein [Chthoniobacter sp.]